MKSHYSHITVLGELLNGAMKLFEGGKILFDSTARLTMTVYQQTSVSTQENPAVTLGGLLRCLASSPEPSYLLTEYSYGYLIMPYEKSGKIWYYDPHSFHWMHFFFADKTETELNDNFAKRSYLAGPDFLILCDEVPSRFSGNLTESVCIKAYDQQPRIWSCEFYVNKASPCHSIIFLFIV